MIVQGFLKKNISIPYGWNFKIKVSILITLPAQTKVPKLIFLLKGFSIFNLFICVYVLDLSTSTKNIELYYLLEQNAPSSLLLPKMTSRWQQNATDSSNDQQRIKSTFFSSVSDRHGCLWAVPLLFFQLFHSFAFTYPLDIDVSFTAGI